LTLVESKHVKLLVSDKKQEKITYRPKPKKPKQKEQKSRKNVTTTTQSLQSAFYTLRSPKGSQV